MVRRNSRRVRLQVEHLEDRLAPATFVWTPTPDILFGRDVFDWHTKENWRTNGVVPLFTPGTQDDVVINGRPQGVDGFYGTWPKISSTTEIHSLSSGAINEGDALPALQLASMLTITGGASQWTGEIYDSTSVTSSHFLQGKLVINGGEFAANYSAITAGSSQCRIYVDKLVIENEALVVVNTSIDATFLDLFGSSSLTTTRDVSGIDDVKVADTFNMNNSNYFWDAGQLKVGTMLVNDSSLFAARKNANKMTGRFVVGGDDIPDEMEEDPTPEDVGEFYVGDGTDATRLQGNLTFGNDSEIWVVPGGLMEFLQDDDCVNSGGLLFENAIQDIPTDGAVFDAIHISGGTVVRSGLQPVAPIRVEMPIISHNLGLGSPTSLFKVEEFSAIRIGKTSSPHLNSYFQNEGRIELQDHSSLTVTGLHGLEMHLLGELRTFGTHVVIESNVTMFGGDFIVGPDVAVGAMNIHGGSIVFDANAFADGSCDRLVVINTLYFSSANTAAIKVNFFNGIPASGFAYNLITVLSPVPVGGTAAYSFVDDVEVFPGDQSYSFDYSTGNRLKLLVL